MLAACDGRLLALLRRLRVQRRTRGLRNPETLIVGILQGTPLSYAVPRDTPIEAPTMLVPSCLACAQHAESQ